VTAIDHGRYAARAAAAYQTMLRRFRKRDGLYRYDEGPPIRAAAQLWPFARAFVATLDVAGIGAGLPGGPDLDRLIAEHLQVLERYWDPAGPTPAYCSDISGAGRRGDRYYDDNAWVGLALIELERLRPGYGVLDRAQDLFRFAASGWDPRDGGVYWVEQGRGTGTRNRDRGTISNAPNAELGLHLAELGRPQERAGSVGPAEMYRWVLETLDTSRASDTPGTGLFWDKVRGDGTIDRATWTYNQGSMIGASVLLARASPTERQAYLERAETIARRALSQFAGTQQAQPAAFHAIFFRNLLLLHAETGDGVLQDQIMATMAEFAESAWPRAQGGRRKLFGGLSGGPSLLEQSAYVQILALLAWAPDSYGRLA
jgi:hypothetical protein